MAVTPDRSVSVLGKPSGGGSGTTTQVVPAGVNQIGAYPAPQGFTGAGIGVAVVDTGIDLNHADLQTATQGPINLFSAFGSSAQDDNGHGTHVSGTIAARHNIRDVVGVAPNATLYAVKVLDASGNGSDSSVIAGLNAVLNANALTPTIHVVNMSLGRPASANPTDDAPMRTAVQNLYKAGITVVVAAGNDCNLEVAQQVPAGFPEVLAIASTTAKAGTKNKFGQQILADTESYQLPTFG